MRAARRMWLRARHGEAAAASAGPAWARPRTAACRRHRRHGAAGRAGSAGAGGGRAAGVCGGVEGQVCTARRCAALRAPALCSCVRRSMHRAPTHPQHACARAHTMSC
eukprot:326417-Chlamydomonas_euryale.AAC.5